MMRLEVDRHAVRRRHRRGRPAPFDFQRRRVDDLQDVRGLDVLVQPVRAGVVHDIFRRSGDRHRPQKRVGFGVKDPVFVGIVMADIQGVGFRVQDNVVAGAGQRNFGGLRQRRVFLFYYIAST